MAGGWGSDELSGPRREHPLAGQPRRRGVTGATGGPSGVFNGGTSTLAVLEIGGNKFGDEAMAALEELKRVLPDLDVAHDKPVRDAQE